MESIIIKFDFLASPELLICLYDVRTDLMETAETTGRKWMEIFAF